MNTATAIISAAAVLGCALCAHYFLSACQAQDYKSAFLYKGIAGLCFVAVGLMLALGCKNSGFGWRVAAGLVMGLAGDQLLALRFLHKEKHDMMFALGTLAFALGHLLYIWALLQLHSSLLPVAVPVWVLGMAASAVYARTRRSNAGKFQAAGFIYVSLVTFMCAAACSAAVNNLSTGALMFAVGGICFVISDNILSAYCFGNKKTAGMNRAIHITYYAAQLLIAFSMALI